MISTYKNCSRPTLFDCLESRTLLAAPPVLSELAVPNESSATHGTALTLTVHATAEAGVRAVTFFIDRDANGRWTEGFDRHLGERYAPDTGTADQYSLTFQADWSVEPFPLFAANAVDVDGQWAPLATSYRANLYDLPSVTQLLAEPISPTQTRLTARVSAPFGAASSGMRGVTFFYDANGNGGWDAGTDTDLGYTETAGGFQQREFTLLATTNLAWSSPLRFAAAAKSAFPDRFGIPRLAVIREGGGTVPAILSSYMTPQGFPNPDQLFAGYHANLTVLWNTPGVTALTLFRDVNLNGMWDHTIDEHLQSWTYGGASSGQNVDVFLDRAWGAGLKSLGLAIRTNPALGNDAWSPVQSVPFVQRFEAWIEPPAQTSFNVALGDVFRLDVVARDENAVRSVTLFADLDGDHHFSAGDRVLGEPDRMSYASRPTVLYHFAWEVDLLAPQTYDLGVFASDFTRPNGPITWLTLSVV